MPGGIINTLLAGRGYLSGSGLFQFVLDCCSMHSPETNHSCLNFASLINAANVLSLRCLADWFKRVANLSVAPVFMRTQTNRHRDRTRIDAHA